MQAEPATLDELVRETAATLEAALGAIARREAQRLVMLAAGIDRTRLLTTPTTTVSNDVVTRARDFAQRRASGEPYAYLAGEREFWGLSFAVGSGVLVPRPESETMIEVALAHLSPDRAATVLDLGTGTGCLLMAVLNERPLAFGIGIDRSADALAYAARNRQALGLAGRCVLARGDWLEPLGGRFDLILANPPYIPAGEIDELMMDVKDHEPRLALDGGADGLAPHRRILASLADHLAPDGLALLEIGHEQGPAARAAAIEAGLRDVRILKDLAGHDRCVSVRRPN